MATDPPDHPWIFISYNHKDKQHLDRLKIFLRPYERDGKIRVWDDSQIQVGKKWRAEIRKAINSANIAILLVSADFLHSEFIANEELPLLLDAANQRGATILSVILSPCAFQA